MLFALALALVAIMGGTLATYLYDEDGPVAVRLCEGAATGFAVFGFAGFIFASFLGLNLLTLALTALVMASPLLLLRRWERRMKIRADFSSTVNNIRRAMLHPSSLSGYVAFYAVVALVLWLAFNRVMFELPDGIYTGVLNNFGDLPFHLSVITGFVYGQNYPPEDPTYAGARFTYPFIVDFISACFVRAGADLRAGMLIENFVLGLSFVGLLHRWALKLVRDRIAAVITPVLVLLSGGLGWMLLFKDARQSEEGILHAILHPGHAYTIIPETTWRWGNAITSLLLPQRSFLLGLPLAVIVFIHWWAALNKEKTRQDKVEVEQKVKGKKKRVERQQASEPLFSDSSFLLSPATRRMMAAGVVAGLLPLVHAHSFVVVMAMGGCLALLFIKEWQRWAVFFACALVVAGPQLWWSTHNTSVQSQSFFGWQFGWDRGTENVFWFWFKNTGLFIPLIVAAFIWKKGPDREYLLPRRVVLFYLPFLLCFIIPNMIRLAPWVWDNIKVLFYWYIASTPIIALLLAKLWRSGQALRITAIALFLSLTLAGGLDVLGLIARRAEFREFDKDGIALAEIIKQNTAPRATILHAPIHNHPVFLTGRRSLMGYPGHIWTHGLQYADRERDIRHIYTGATDAPALMARYGVEYVVVGPLEKLAMPVNEQFFTRYTKVGDAGEYHLYKISRQ